MKDLTKIILIFAMAYLFLRFAPAIPISSVVTQKQDLFTVTGTGKVTVVPDTAIINTGITSFSTTVSLAQSQSNSIINKISDSLKKLGISEIDIKTSNYSIYPQYDYSKGSMHISGYTVSAFLDVTIRNLDKLNEAIDVSTSNGANTISGIQLTVDEDKRKQLEVSARDIAIKGAKSKAEGLARAAGISLGRIVNVQESSPSYPRPYLAISEKTVGLGGGGEPTQIQPGSTDITSTVTLSYETR